LTASNGFDAWLLHGWASGQGRPGADIFTLRHSQAILPFAPPGRCEYIGGVSLSRHKETVGFLCRWLLLVAAVGGVCLCGYVIASSSSSPPSVVRAPIFDDLVLAPGAKGRLTGNMIYMPRGGGMSLMIRVGDGPVRSCPVFSESVSQPVVAPLEKGMHTVRITGEPHGPLAFQELKSNLLVIGLDEPLCLVDAAVVELADTALRKWILNAWLAQKGKKAYLHAGGARELDAFRSLLRSAGDESPVIGHLRSNMAFERLINAVVSNIHLGRRSAGVCVVTSNEPLALLAARHGMDVTLISQRPAREVRNLRRVGTIEELGAEGTDAAR